MTKCGSTVTLNIISRSNLSNSPTPTTPTTPTVDGSTPSSRPSSRRTPRSDDICQLRETGESKSKSPWSHIRRGCNYGRPTVANFFAGECNQFAECDSGYTKVRGSPVQYAKPARLSFCNLSQRRFTRRGVSLENDNELPF